MSNRKQRKQGRPMKSDRVWIQPEPNEELDARKLSRAFLALALHQAADEAAAREEHVTKAAPGDGNESA
jgi:Flp pilus assembly protein CpaB